jgi:hypothetical protein
MRRGVFFGWRRRRKEEEEDRTRTREERSFVPPFQQQEERITTTSGLIRSWSIRTTRLCLAVPPPQGVAAPRTLTSEVGRDRHPGGSRKIFFEELSDMFEKEIACDLSFRVDGAAETVVHAHRCIVAARCPKLFFDGTPFEERNSTGSAQAVISVRGIFARYPHLLRGAIASFYGADASKKGPLQAGWVEEIDGYSGRPYYVNQLDGSTTWESKRISDEELVETGYWADPGTILEDLAQLKPERSQAEDDLRRQQGLPLIWRNEGIPPIAPADVCIVGSFDASPSNDMDWRVDAHAPILSAHSEYFRAALTRWSTE